MPATPDSTHSAPNAITSDAIYRVMRERIVTAQWQPGERLVQRQLAKEFGASSIPVLEAIRRLESDGLVVSHPNAGAQVKGWTADDVRTIYEARAALEGITCRLFAEQARPEHKADVARISELFDQASLAGDSDRSRLADVEFHLTIMRQYDHLARSNAMRALAQNAFLISVTIRSVIVRNGEEDEMVGTPADDPPLEIQAGIHDAVVQAFWAGDGDAAASAIRTHVLNGRDTVLRCMRSNANLWLGSATPLYGD